MRPAPSTLLTSRFACRSSSPLRSAFGTFTLHAYETGAGQEHAALVHGDPEQATTPLVRVQSACLTGSVLHSELCDCRQQLHEALRLIGQTDGVVVLLDDEGRAHGLVEKVAQLELIAQGADTVEAARRRGREADLRTYDDAVAILHELVGDCPVRLLTNNPTKLKALVETGLSVANREPLETTPTEGNRRYLEVKKYRMGHLLSQV
jgi:GTP cyclohydrolase II